MKNLSPVALPFFWLPGCLLFEQRFSLCGPLSLKRFVSKRYIYIFFFSLFFFYYYYYYYYYQVTIITYIKEQEKNKKQNKTK